MEIDINLEQKLKEEIDKLYCQIDTKYKEIIDIHKSINAIEYLLKYGFSND